MTAKKSTHTHSCTGEDSAHTSPSGHKWKALLRSWQVKTVAGTGMVAMEAVEGLVAAAMYSHKHSHCNHEGL